MGRFNRYPRHTVADLDRIRRERYADFRRWAPDYIGGQIQFIQHARGRESVQVLAEIRAVECEGENCVFRVANLRRRNRDRLERWQYLADQAELTIELRMIGKLERRTRITFEYSDWNPPLHLDRCFVALWPKGENADIWARN
ncbi:hypothetical protein C4552_03075 [Candidatus Parcubacteria bacterium]|nr:MAG: hypothetical protein C4552_03075 [Candidatus Parcubacteria bacterium]